MPDQQTKLRLLFFYISELLISPFKIDVIIEKIMQEVEAFFHPTNWSILRYDPAANELFFLYAKGLDEKKVREIRLKKGEGIVGTVAQTGKSLFIRDCQSDPRFTNKLDKIFKQKTKSVITVPIQFKQTLLGVLELVNLEDNEHFTEDDCFLLEVIANFAAIALINSMLFENIITISNHDPLTGIYNRTKLEETLKKWQSNPARYAEKQISIFSMDLNNFKKINDQYGHHEGDKILKQTAREIGSKVEQKDLFFRTGGDEFLYLEIHDDPKTAKVTEQKLFEMLEKISRQLEPNVGCFSIGCKTGPIKDIEILISEADKAMLLDKKQRKAGRP